MSRFTAAALLVTATLFSLRASPAAAVVAETPHDTAEAQTDDALGLSLGVEFMGRSLLGMGFLVEYAFSETLRAHGGVNAGMLGQGFPIGLTVTPLGNDGWTPLLQGGVMIVRTHGGCGGGCDASVDYDAIAQAGLGAVWYGENWWFRGEAVAHWVGTDIAEFVVLPGVSTGYAF